MNPVFSQFPIHAVDASLLPSLQLPGEPLERVWVQGKVESLDLLRSLPERGLAVVGSRNLQTRTERHVRSTILELQGQQLTILSGLALGVDTVAHESALLAGLPTIAVLAHGLHEIFPLENGRLALRILESGGLLFTQYPLGQRSTGDAFLSRNRWIAALAQAVWVAQAAYRSGALNTARHARELGRRLYATPCFPGDPALSGNEKLFNQDEALALRDAFDFGSTWMELVSQLAGLRNTRRKTKKESVLQRARALTVNEGMPLLSALRKIAADERRPYESILLDFERQMKEASSRTVTAWNSEKESKTPG